jgi:hypothetical protein
MVLSHQTGVRFPIALPLQNALPDEEKALRGFFITGTPLPKSTEYPTELRKCDSAVIVRGKRSRNPDYSYMQKSLNYIISLA